MEKSYARYIKGFMSRIGRQTITIPDSVTISLNEGVVTVKGPKGELAEFIPTGIKVEVQDIGVVVKRTNEALQSKANHGLMNRLIQNMIIGVTQGFSKKLELVGTGYRVKMQGTGVVVSAGYSHPVNFPAPQGITLSTESETVIKVSGIKKQQVGEIAAKLRAIRPPEPYKGKGIRYVNEVIRRKAGKATKVGSG